MKPIEFIQSMMEGKVYIRGNSLFWYDSKYGGTDRFRTCSLRYCKKDLFGYKSSLRDIFNYPEEVTELGQKVKTMMESQGGAAEQCFHWIKQSCEKQEALLSGDF